MDVVDRYLQLGLRLGRHVDGLVDAYFGPAEIAHAVGRERLRPAAELATDAAALRAELAAAEELDPPRRAWLDDQLLGIVTYAAALAGEGISYADEVERCFGVRPERIPESVFEEAQAQLDAILPGDGTLAERFEEWRRACLVPAHELLDLSAQLSRVLRAATERRFGLPPDEDVQYVLAPDEPWAAYNYYLGGRRSRIAVNPDLPFTSGELLNLVAHEAYPGHHTEHAWKEHALVGTGVLEESLLLVPTPQSMVSEAIAENALAAIEDAGTAAAVSDVFAAAHVRFDFDEVGAVQDARRKLRFVMVNTALLLHEDGATREQAVDYTERWSARGRDAAASSVRFISDPLWRAYAPTYALGGALCRHLSGRSDAFRDLLTRHIRVADLLEDRAAVSSAP